MTISDALLRWMCLHQSFYFGLVGVLVTFALVLAIVPLLRDHVPEKREHDWKWGLLIFAILAAGRWPSIFFYQQLNLDESLFLAGGRVLLGDPVFWRSVEGGTSGPLNFFALWPAGWIFGWETFLTARVTAYLLLAITLVWAHQCMALVLGRKVSRIAGLATVCLEALTNDPDLLHYSSELMSVMLLTVSTYAAIRRWIHQGGLKWIGFGGLLLGAVPLAKLQAAPMSAAMGLVWLLAEVFAREPHRVRRIAFLLSGAVFTAALFACQLTFVGRWENAIISYFLSNVEYSKTGAPPLQWIKSFFWDHFLDQDSLLPPWLQGSCLWAMLMLRWRRTTDQPTAILKWLGLGACLLALGIVVYPRKPFLHYWQFAIVPMTLFLGALTGSRLPASAHSWRKFDQCIVALCAFLVVGTMLGERAWSPNQFMGTHHLFSKEPVSKLSSRIAPFVRPGDSVAIWGWSSYVYVETGLKQGTEIADFTRTLLPGPHRVYFRNRFLFEIKNNKPRFFLDSVGPCSHLFQDGRFTHDQNFPELALLISKDYIQVDAVSGARLYRRNRPD